MTIFMIANGGLLVAKTNLGFVVLVPPLKGCTSRSPFLRVEKSKIQEWQATSLGVHGLLLYGSVCRLQNLEMYYMWVRLKIQRARLTQVLVFGFIYQAAIMVPSVEPQPCAHTFGEAPFNGFSRQSSEVRTDLSRGLLRQVQISRGDSGSASQTLSDALVLYRDLSQKAREAVSRVGCDARKGLRRG